MKKIFTMVIAIVLIFVACSAITSKGDESSNPGDSTKPPKNNTENVEKPALEAYTTELSNGHYTAGVDFPAGTYNITVVSGQGNVSTSNMFSGGLNEIMGEVEDDLHTTSFNGAKLEKGVVISVSSGMSSMIIKIESDAADVAGVTPRTTDLTEEVQLSSGNYTAGVDFPAGTYNIIASKGNGNVSSSNLMDKGINAVIGVENNGFNVTEFKNVELDKDVTLKISGVSITLIPSK